MNRSGRFLLVTWDGGGNVPSAVNLGSHLIRRGNRVRMLGWDSMAGRAAAAGLEFDAFATVPPWPAGLTQDDGWEMVDRSLNGAAVRDEICDRALAFSPDVLIVDCMMGAAFAAADRLPLPTAALVHVLHGPFVHLWGNGIMHRDVAEMLAAADVVLALTPPGFDEPGDLPVNTVQVGPVGRPGRPAAQAAPFSADLAMIDSPGDPWVLVSLSTTLQGQTETLPAILEALGRLPLRVLLTLGGVVGVDAVRAPANVVVRAALPHDVILSHMKLVISHGGLSTITSALAAGVPMVLIPQGREQPLNAHRVVACGVGAELAKDSSPGQIAAAVQTMLHDQAAHARARRFAEQIAGLGRGSGAADLVEGLLHRAETRAPGHREFANAHRA